MCNEAMAAARTILLIAFVGSCAARSNLQTDGGLSPDVPTWVDRLDPAPPMSYPPPPQLPACPGQEELLGEICVRPALARTGKVSLAGTVTAIGIGADCLDFAAGSPERRRGFELTDPDGNRRQFVILMPGLELPFQVGDAVTAVLDNKRQFDYYYVGYEFSVLRGSDLLLHIGVAHTAQELAAPGGISFQTEAGTCLASEDCGRYLRHPLKASSPTSSASLVFGEAATLDGYRVLHAGATSEVPGPRLCADYSRDWVRVVLARINRP
jgi:hypothetical protein